MLIIIVCSLYLLFFNFDAASVVCCRYGQLGVGDDKGWCVVKYIHIPHLFNVIVIVILLSTVAM